MKRFFNQCGRYRRSLAFLAGGVLPDLEKDQINHHLATCAKCRKYYMEMKSVTGSLLNWEGNFAELQPEPTAQARWARAVQAVGRPEVVRQSIPAAGFREWWQDVIWSYRRIWVSLAAVWLLIFAGQFSLRDHPRIMVAKSSPPAQEMIMAFRDRRAILAELLADQAAPREADRPKFITPKPRTEYVRILTA